jgi:hypothetical protein
MPSPKKFFKRLFISLLVLIGVFVVSTFVIAGFFGDKVGQLILTEVRKQIVSDLEVGDLSLNLLWTFPNASVDLNQVVLKDASNKDVLLSADKLSFRIGLMSLIRGKYVVNSFLVKNAKIRLHTDRKGRSNFDIAKKKENDDSAYDEPESSDISFSIRKAYLMNVDLEYVDQRSEQDMAMLVKDASFSGNFSAKKFDLDSYAELQSKKIEIGEDKYLVNKDISFDAYVNIDSDQGVYGFDDVTLTIDRNKFKLDGSVKSKDDITDFDLKAQGINCRLGSLLGLLPSTTTEGLAGFDSKATLEVDATIKGEYSKDKIPRIDAKLSLEDGKVEHPRLAKPLKDVSFALEFNTGRKGNGDDATLNLTQFNAELDGHPINLKLDVNNLNEPYVDFGFNGKISMATAYGFLGEGFTEGNGMLDMEEFRVKGKFEDMLSSNGIGKVDASGTVNFIDIELERNDEEVSIPTGRLAFSDNKVNLSNFTFEGAGSDFKLQASIENLIPALLVDSLNSNNISLDFSGAMSSRKMDFRRIVNFFSDPSSVTAGEANNEAASEAVSSSGHSDDNSVTFLDLLNGSFTIMVDEFEYKRVKGKRFRSDIIIKDKLFNLKGTQCEAMGGTLRVDARYDYRTKAPNLEAYVETKTVDVSRLLFEMEEFDQKTMTSKNLKGKLDALILVRAFWDVQGNFMDKNLYVLADVVLKDGELIEFDMLREFSSFVKVKDLERIVFSDLRNQFEIKDRQFIMPAMFIQSNALNLVVAGKHGFNGDIDYKIKVNAGQIMGEKLKKFDPSYKPKKARKNGFINMYFQIVGNLDGKYEVKRSKKTVKQALEEDEKRQFQSVQNTLRMEFDGIQIVQEPIELEDIPEYGSDGKIEEYNGGEDEYIEFQ